MCNNTQQHSSHLTALPKGSAGVLSFWATTEAATVDKLRLASVSSGVRRVGPANCSFRFRDGNEHQLHGMHAACSIHTGSTANLANDFLTRNRASQELAVTCKYAFRKFLLFESIC